MKLRLKPDGRLKLLCYDIENKPGTYGPGDFTHGKVTAIAAQFIGDGEMRSWVMRRSSRAQVRRAAESFRKLWEEADIVVGHNIRRHDKKLLDGFYTTLDLPVLPRRRAIDTYLDQPKMAGLSRSLENLCARWGCPERKIHMPEHAWEFAYDGVPEYVDLMRERCESDVRINIWLYHELLRRRLL